MMTSLQQELKERLPGIIVSSPDAALYSVVDVRNIAKPNFKSLDFVLFCAQKGKVEIEGKYFTLLTAPMSGFYNTQEGIKNPGDTQMRIAFIEQPEKMKLIPYLFDKLFTEYERNH